MMTASDTSPPTTCRCGEWPISEYGPVCPSCIADDYTAALAAARALTPEQQRDLCAALFQTRAGL
jgi:hypothetical protein